MGNELTTTTKQSTAITSATPTDVLAQLSAVQQLMSTAMREKEHYGTIPGCGTKKVLMKSGAEKLGLMFRLSPTYKVETNQLGNGHRENVVVCTLKKIGTDEVWAEGVGSCSTMETKYRYRGGQKQVTDTPVPQDYWTLRKTKPVEALALLGGPGHGFAKDDNGQWKITIQGDPVENTNIADTYNTVLKMAKKRAYVDAMLSATAASDIFTQDLEDIQENERTLRDVEAEVEGEATPPHPTMPAEHKAPPKAPPKAKEPVQPAEGELVVGGSYPGVVTKDGKSARGPWTRYSVRMAGAWFSTFDHKVGDQLSNLIGTDVIIGNKAETRGNQTNNVIVSVEPHLTEDRGGQKEYNDDFCHHEDGDSESDSLPF